MVDLYNNVKEGAWRRRTLNAANCCAYRARTAMSPGRGAAHTKQRAASCAIKRNFRK